MSRKPPAPPAELWAVIINIINSYSSDPLRHVARYAERIAEHTAREVDFVEQLDDPETDDRPDDRPDDGPSKATIIIKRINNDR